MSGPPRGARRGTSTVLAGAVVSGLATYGYQVLGVRVLGEEAYAPVSVLWTVQYLAFAVLLFPFEAFVASGPPGRARLCLLWTVALAAAVGGGLAAAAGRLPGGPVLLGLGGAAVVLSYGGFTVARGLLAARGDTVGYGLATAGEAAVRLVLTVPVVALVPSATAVAWLLASGPPVVLAGLWLTGRLRSGGGTPPPADPGDGPEGAGARHLVAGTLAGAGVQLGLAAGPLLVPLLGGGPREVTVAFVTLTAARMPVFLALGGLVSGRLPGLVARQREGREAEIARDSRRTALVAAGIAILAAPVGALVGPLAIEVLFGAGARPSAAFVAVVAAGVVLASGALLVNQAVLVRERIHRLLAAWALATAAGALTVVAVPVDPLLRIALALLVGQVTGLAGLVLPDVRQRASATSQ